MNEEQVFDIRPPRFYREPGEEDIETNGLAMARINARIRARIIGSRVLSASVALGIGTAITVHDQLYSGNVKPADWAANLMIPAFINGIAELKIERQLRHTGQEIAEIIPGISDTTQM